MHFLKDETLFRRLQPTDLNELINGSIDIDNLFARFTNITAIMAEVEICLLIKPVVNNNNTHAGTGDTSFSNGLTPTRNNRNYPLNKERYMKNNICLYCEKSTTLQ